MIVGGLACADPEAWQSQPIPVDLDHPRVLSASVAAPDLPFARLVGTLDVITDRPTALTVEVDDPCGTRRIRFPGERAEHAVELRGLHAGATHAVRVTVSDPQGATTVDVGPLTTTTPPLPPVEVLAHDPGAMEPGLLVLAVKGRGEPWLVVVDEALHPVYAMPRKLFHAELDRDGTWVALQDNRAARFTMQGDEVDAWLEGRDDYNHEALPGPGGSVFTFGEATARIEAYPTTDGEVAPRDVLSQTVLELTAGGGVVERLRLFDVLDPEHAGFKSREPGLTADWSHANAISPWGDDAWLISVRHLDVIACVGHDGALRWLLGDPAGWVSPWAEAFLEPVGPVRWHRHPHAVQALPGGRLALFDNGNYDGSPYTPPSEGYVPVSRLAGWAIDEAAGTAEQLWSFPYDDLYSPAMGSAYVLPQTGNVLGVFSRLGVNSSEYSRIVQVHPDRPDAPALDVKLGVDVNRFVYRVTHVPDLYGDDVVEERIARATR